MGIDAIERIQAEKALRESEELRRLILDNVEDLIFICGIDGKLTYGNKALQRIMGYSEDEFVGKHYLHFIHKDDRQREIDSYIAQVNENVDTTYHDYRMVFKDGSVHWISQTTRMVTKQDGQVEFFGIARDITERKGAEDALKRSEEKFRNLVSKISEAIYQCDMHGYFTYMSPVGLAILGYTHDEIIRLRNVDIVHPDYSDDVIEHYGRQFDEHIPNTYLEFPVIRKDGSTLWSGHAVSLVENDSGELEFYCIARDITERKKIEEALRESEMRHRIVLDNVIDFIFICGVDGKFFYCNNSLERVTGYTKEEVLGKSYLHFVHRDDRGEALDHYARQIKDNVDMTYFEYRLIRKDGAIAWMAQTINMVKNREGEIEFFGIARDVTKRKEEENTRRELEEQKTLFFANVSHEIRTPLTLMLSPIESYLQGDYHEEIGKKFFESLYRNGLRLLKLINNLLDFSKIEAGRTTMKIVELDIVSFIRNYVATLQSACDSKGIILGFMPPGKISNLYADMEKIDRIFMNILSNSLKFTDRGGIITLKVREDDVFCYIDIEDTGQGIPADSIDMIFERFGQADTLSTRGHIGTGIGLSLAKELVEMHGGTITVKSRYIEEYPEEHGTIFTITLLKGTEHFEMMPNVARDDSAPHDGSPSIHRFAGMREMYDLQGEGLENTSFHGFTGNEVHDSSQTVKPVILIVDDNSDMREFLVSIMKDTYALVTAENGLQGFDVVVQHMPDLVITDVMMPVMDGFEMTRRIKESEKLKHIPVIMLTAKAEISQKIEGIEFGADDYLIKPFNTKELLTRVMRLLKTREYERTIAQRNYEIEQELEIARMLQHRLLPEKELELSGYRSHAIYIPMDRVGGDFYDWRVSGNAIELMIADVSGHGLPGAFLSTITKISSDSIRDRVSPGDTLRVLNEVVLRSTVNSNYVTAFLCMIDTGSNVMTFCNAGHFPQLLLNGHDGTLTELKAKGKPLGWYDSAEYEESEVQLHPGDRLILYTDGITECSNSHGEMFGQDRFYEFICVHRNDTPRQFSERIVRELKDFTGDDVYDDDVSMVVFDIL